MPVSAPRALDTPAEQIDATIAKAIELARSRPDAGRLLGRHARVELLHGSRVAAGHAFPWGYRHPREQDLVATLLKAQRPDGSWEAYYQAPQGDINGTVECYAALRCVGFSRRRRAARARAALDLRARRLARHPRLHALLARAASANGRGAQHRTCRPRSSRTRAGGSTSTTSRAGRGRPCCRSRCCRHGAPCGRCRPSAGSTSSFRTAATRWITACRGAARGCRGAGCSWCPTGYCTSTNSSASHPAARWRSTRAWAGSCATKTPMARGAGFNRRGSTA